MENADVQDVKTKVEMSHRKQEELGRQRCSHITNSICSIPIFSFPFSSISSLLLLLFLLTSPLLCLPVTGPRIPLRLVPRERV